MKTYLLCILSFSLLLGCSNKEEKHQHSGPEIKDSTSTSSFTEIVCSPFYQVAGYTFSLINFAGNHVDEGEDNTVFTLDKMVNGQYVEIFRDSIFSTVNIIRFEDYNGDGAMDLLIQHDSDVRSNWTYHLYLADSLLQNLQRIKGFEDIKNPHYLSKYNLIDNYVNSGRNWTQFFKIKGDSIVEYGFTIYDGENENGETTYETEYEKALKEILATENKRDN